MGDQAFYPMVSEIPSRSNYAQFFPLLEQGKNYVINFDTLLRMISLIGEEYLKNQNQFEQLFEQIEYCTNYIRSLESKKPKSNIISKLPPIMANLIEIAKQNENIIKILYEINDDDVTFNLILDDVNAESYKMSSELEIELSAKYGDVDMTVNPIDRKDIEINEKYQIYTKT